MVLALQIVNREKGQWLALENEEIKAGHDFMMASGQDNILAALDKFLKKQKLAWFQFNGLLLLVQEASLTQVKIITAIINTLAWQFNWSVAGEFYKQKNLEQALPELLDQLKQQKKFKPLAVKYQRQPEITISHKPTKYIIIK